MVGSRGPDARKGSGMILIFVYLWAFVSQQIPRLRVLKERQLTLASIFIHILRTLPPLACLPVSLSLVSCPNPHRWHRTSPSKPCKDAVTR